MDILVKISDTKKVNCYPQPKKNRKDASRYDIFLLFSFYESGFLHFTTVISLGITLPIKNWGEKQAVGKSDNTALINSKITKFLSSAELLLQKFAFEKEPTVTELKEFIQSTVKTQLTGKPPRGKRKEVEKRMQEQMKERTVNVVMEGLIKYRNLSKGRARVFRHAVNNVLHRFFKETKGSTPPITEISKKDLMDLEMWYRDNIRVSRGKRKGLTPSQNSTTTWFTMIASLFKFSVVELEIMEKSPLPKNFRGAFIGADKKVLDTDDSLKVMQLSDHRLSRPQQVAKYCLMFGLATGMAMVDIKTLRSEHVKYDREVDRLRIKKIREKHLNNAQIKNPKPFRVVLTATAEHAYHKLRALSPGGGDLCFELTSDTNLTKHYKNLMKLAGVTVNTTHYVLRHSFAVDYMDHDGRLEDLGKMLGNDIRSTEIYGKVSEKRLAAKTKQLERKSLIHQLPTSLMNGSSQLRAS
ncbi:tyrosine-type recombinase/integrase [Flavisolibacter nicotianae]|uniref:tyrosine-type recombinase/integrase n=1 Tax=Flavisolibacter nicotianae TaxID=2364882 RepID=UPI000EAD94BA|nr:tyrosine-type recombinase/integrase [Flavisolibacter nicotianae]